MSHGSAPARRRDASHGASSPGSKRHRSLRHLLVPVAVVDHHLHHTHSVEMAAMIADFLGTVR
jgi:hypothetical protein